MPLRWIILVAGLLGMGGVAWRFLPGWWLARAYARAPLCQTTETEDCRRVVDAQVVRFGMLKCGPGSDETITVTVDAKEHEVYVTPGIVDAIMDAWDQERESSGSVKRPRARVELWRGRVTRIEVLGVSRDVARGGCRD